MYKLCADYAQIMNKLCTNYVQIMHKLCTNYVQIVSIFSFCCGHWPVTLNRNDTNEERCMYQIQ